MWSPDSMDACDSALRLSRRRMSFIWDLISDRDDSVYTEVVLVIRACVAVVVLLGWLLGELEHVLPRRPPTRIGTGRQAVLFALT